MKRCHDRGWLPLLLIALGAIALLTSCGREPAPLEPHHEQRAPAAKSADADTLASFVVRYDGREFDGEQTSFDYNLAGTGAGDEPTYKLYLELPDCAPELASYEPVANAVVGYFPNVDLDGIRWTVVVEPDDLVGQAFRITFDGEVDEGAIRTAVSVDHPAAEIGMVRGPCGGSTVAGVVFVDADEDGAYEPATEGGLANVLVQAVDAHGQVEAALTDSTGAYAFQLVAGTYTVRVDTTEHNGTFNGDLGIWWQATTPLGRVITVPPDTAGVDFGFQPATDDIIEDVEDGDLQSLGVPVKFWINELLGAIAGIPQPEGVDVMALPFWAPTYTPEEMLAFLLAVEALALPLPYDFTDGDEFDDALAILQIPNGPPVDVLRQELLATELNFVADRGFVDDPALLEALVIWGESLVAQAERDGLTGRLAGEAAAPRRVEDLRIAIDVFHTINVGGGGGFDGK